MALPEHVVKEFYEQMGSWEKECLAKDKEEDAGLIGHEAARKYLIERRNKIYRQLCSTRKLDAGINYSVPPRYDIKALVITEVLYIDSGVAEVSVRDARGNPGIFPCVYQLKKQDEEWKISKKYEIMRSGKRSSDCLL